MSDQTYQTSFLPDYHPSTLFSTYPEPDQPIYRLRTNGPKVLSNIELLAVLGGLKDAAIAQALSNVAKNYSGLNIPRDELLQINGIGEVLADRLIACFELAARQRAGSFCVRDEPTAIHNPTDIYNLVGYDMATLEQEELWVILLNTRNGVMEIDHLYKGSVNSSQVRLGEVFKQAVRKGATNIIMVHNHPSGDPVASAEDVNLTRSAVQAGKLLDIDLLYHVIIGRSGKFASLKERGLGFS